MTIATYPSPVPPNLSETKRRLRILVDVAIAEALRERQTDLRTAGAELIRETMSAMAHPRRYFALRDAGAMAMRFPATSSRM